jgi:hypothetical protein
MSRHYTLKPAKFLLRFEPSHRASARGGQLAAAAVVEQFGLWKRVKREPALDPRKDRHKGYEPMVYVAAVLFTLTSGGCTLEDVEDLNDDEALKALLGVKKFPDPTAIGEWLRNVGPEGWDALRRIGREFVAWSLKRAEPARYLHAGHLECFFDDTQLEVSGASFEGAQINYEGKLALGWQTLWVGPFLVDGVLGYRGMDVSSHLQPLLEANATLWKKETSHLYADSASSSGSYLELVEAYFDSWTVSYNKWTGPLEQRAQEFPDAYWSAAVPVKGRKGEPAIEQFAWLRYQPEGCQRPKQFAVARRRSEGELLWRYGFVACPQSQGLSPQMIFERHHLKGDRERLFSDVLRDLDLHHPPCQSLSANRVYYALALLAYNVLQALKLIWLPVTLQAQRVRTLIHHLLLVPVEIKRHARRVLACFYAPAGRLAWWQRFLAQLLPRCQLIGATALTG